MVGGNGSQLTAICAVSSFLWLSHNFERHALLEHPRTSELLLFIISGIVVFATSFFAKWLPGANGRFDDEVGSHKGPSLDSPRRPRRYFPTLLVFCIVARLEIFHWMSENQQCSRPGVESLLPLLLLGNELYQGHRRRPAVESPESFSNTVFDDFADWFKTTRTTLLLSTILLAVGAYLAMFPTIRSNYICRSSTTFILFPQFLGVALDAAIITLVWRIVTWARTTKSRLKTLSGILLASAFLLCIGAMVVSLLGRLKSPRWSVSSAGLDSLYFFDIFIDAIVFSVMFVSTTLFVCDSTPLTLAGLITAMSGFVASFQKATTYGSFEQISRVDALLPLYILSMGFTIFIFGINMRSIFFIRRVFWVLIICVLWIAAAILVLVRGQILDRHPLNKLVYETRVEADRWLVHASVSKSLHIAVQEYQERHHGRDPPANFEAWYGFANVRGSVIIDHFQQIENDIWPFWGMQPAKIRESVDALASDPAIAFVTVKDGIVSHSETKNGPNKEMLDGLVDLIKPFAKQLSDMTLPVNLVDRPRVLSSWDTIHRLTKTSESTKFKAVSRRSIDADETAPLVERQNTKVATKPTILERDLTPPWVLREMASRACSPGSTASSGVHWNVRDFCSSCTRPQSEGLFLKNVETSDRLCHQPDITRLHGFYMQHLTQKPFTELVPIFSRSKVDGFNDILIPLNRPNDTQTGDTGATFNSKRDRLFWRGQINQGVSLTNGDLFYGGHQERLAHYINNASVSDEVTILLPLPDNKKKLTYEHVPLKKMDKIMTFDVGIGDYGGCTGSSCDVAKQEFGFKKTDVSPLNNRYVLLVDSDDAPPRDILRTLRSTSVPFIASIFKEWYTERLMPWIHYVPIDIRYHGLHSTYAYFAGIRGKEEINGRHVEMNAQAEDAKWIAEQGKRWAERAIRKEDMEIYLFRLLLEWGRVIDDRRDEIGFVLPEGSK